VNKHGEFVVQSTTNLVDMAVKFTRKTGRTVVKKRGLTMLLAQWNGEVLVVLSRCGLSLADQADVESALRIEALHD
jgi:hypothetical protein